MNMKDVGDVAAGAIAFKAVTGFVPEIAAVLAIVWTLIRIYEWSRFRIFKMDDKETFK